MPTEHKVKQGEDISSIAERFGLSPDTVWNDPANSALKDKRKNPDVLYPGDIVTIPDKKEKEESGATEQRHRFRRKTTTAVLRLKIVDEDEPGKNLSYTLEIDGKTYKGETDSEGMLEQRIPKNAKTGKLIIDDTDEEYQLELGVLDPVEEITGVQQRLANLGYDCGRIDGQTGPLTKKAIMSFQERCGLEKTGESDDKLQKELLKQHGS